MKRKEFLQTSLAGLVIPTLISGIPLRGLLPHPLLSKSIPPLGSDRVLVIIQLAGGNDGLNTVVPLDQYGAYQAARSNIALPEDRLLRLKGFDQAGLHPAMEGLARLFNEGKAGIIQGVGYPKPNFSHFRATDIWMTGSDSDKVLSTGWAGRYLDQRYPGFPESYPSRLMPDPLAIQVGSVVSETFQGPVFNMGLAISNPAAFYQLLEGQPASDLQSRWGEQLAFIEEMSQKTDQYSGVIRSAAQKVSRQSSNYPDTGKNPLADQLKIVARLIAGGLQTRIYMVNTGSFDTHSKQTESDTSTGAHAKLLQRVSEAISVFMEDLAQLQVGQKVMGITFSEFGRRIKSNASGGTDHGAAAPLFYFGHAIRGGVLGENPLLPFSATVNDNIPMQHDFRSVYASILVQWLGMAPNELPKVLEGNFPSLPLI